MLEQALPLTSLSTPESGTLRRRMIAVGMAFAAHHYGYATLVTSLPMLKQRIQIGDFGLSMLLLGVTLCAALGAMISDPVAARHGSRTALVIGLVLEGIALVAVAFAQTIQGMTFVLLISGLGLGFVGAAANMQMGILERAWGRPIFGRFYAAGTSASIVSTMVTLALLSAGFSGITPIVIAAFIAVAAGLNGIRGFDPRFASQSKKDKDQPGAQRVALPILPLIGVGIIVLGMSSIDTTVATWATIYGADILQLSPAFAALGYSIYLASVLATRLATDRLQRRFGRRNVAMAAAATGTIGFILIVIAHPAPLALAGFCIAGIATAAIVPIAYGRASELVPERSDQVIARVNLFDYAGALLGTVLPGLITTVVALNWAYALPVTVLVLCIPLFSVLKHVQRI